VTVPVNGQDSNDKKSPDPWKRQVFFGEQHLHTRNSPDAFAAGARQSWDATYEYAMGKEVTLSTAATDNKIRKSTPYDFVSITDHAEYFGVMPRLVDPKDPLAKTAFAKKLHPPRMNAASFSLDQVMEKLQEGGGSK